MAALDPKAWQGRNVLITGHTGFKGSWLGQVMQSLGANVSGFSLAPETQPSHFETVSWKGLKHQIGDIRDHASLTRFVKESRPEVVFHMAAQPLVLRSYHEPRFTYETNVMGTLNLLEAVRETPSVRAVVVVTSDKCYENREVNHAYREEDPMGGYDPYSSSKGCAEILTSSYRRSFFDLDGFGSKHNVLIASARAGNVLGGGDWSDNRLIPDFARAFRDGKKVTIRSPKAVRPWQHVLEPLNGYMLLAEKLLAGQKDFASAWNFGPEIDGCWTVEQIVKEAQKIWSGFEFEIVNNDRHEATLLMLDSAKAKAQLQWLPVLNVEETLKWTLQWYKDYLRDGKVDTSAQIEEYLVRQSR